MNGTPSAQEWAELEWLANIGEIAGPLAHEFNNFLNVCLLNVALMEPEVSAKLQPFLKEILQQGRRTAEMIQQLQSYRRRQHPLPQRVDLNEVVREVLHDPSMCLDIHLLWPAESGQNPTIPEAGIAVIPLLHENLPPVLGSGCALKHLVSFLLANAVAALQGHGTITVRTEWDHAAVRLRLEDTGPSVAPELLPQLFEPFTVGRQGTSSLELAACKSLLRRMEGKIHGENRAEGGLAIIVEMKADQSV